MTSFQEIGTVSTSDLCMMLGLTRSRVGQLVSDGIIPAPITRGRYDCISSVNAYIRFLNMKSYKQEIRQLGQNEYEYQRSRLIKARADTMELKRHLVERSLIPVAEANQVWELIAANCYLRGARVSDCAETLLRATSVREVHSILQVEIYNMLQDFANMEIKPEV